MSPSANATSDKVFQALEARKNEVRTLSNTAYRASDQARETETKEDHAAAAKAHEAAFKEASKVGMQYDASSHAKQAAEHEAAASDPSSAAYKTREARAASKKAFATGDPDDHLRAAEANEDAAAASKSEKGENWTAASHAEAGDVHRFAHAKLGGSGPPDAKAEDLPDDEKEWVEKDPTGYPRADNPPGFVDDEAAWEKAKKAVRPHWDSYDEPWAVVATVYKNMAG